MKVFNNNGLGASIRMELKL